MHISSPTRKPTRISSDIISSLPDGLILHILDYLPHKFAVRTTALSKRWRPLFRSLPRLILNYYPNNWDAVDTILRQRDTPILICEIGVDYTNRSKADEVLSHLFSNGLQNLKLHNQLYDYVVPQNVFSCRTLVELNLSVVDLKLPERVILPALKHLMLFCVNSTGEDLGRLVSGCMNLEEFVIDEECNNNERNKKLLKWSSKSVTSFDFRVDAFDWNMSFKDLSRLKRVSASFMSRGYRFFESKSHEHGRERIKSDEKAKVLQFLGDVSHVEYLHLFFNSQYYSQAFEELPKKLPGGVLLHNLKKLVWDDFVRENNDGFYSLFILLLHHSPNLEELDIKFGYLPWKKTNKYSWEGQNSIPCVMHTLKFVKILMTFVEDEECLSFAKFFLVNAKAMVEMKILYFKFVDMVAMMDRIKLSVQGMEIPDDKLKLVLLESVPWDDYPPNFDSD